jgi:hypothetical protein
MSVTSKLLLCLGAFGFTSASFAADVQLPKESGPISIKVDRSSDFNNHIYLYAVGVYEEARVMISEEKPYTSTYMNSEFVVLGAHEITGDIVRLEAILRSASKACPITLEFDRTSLELQKVTPDCDYMSELPPADQAG